MNHTDLTEDEIRHFDLKIAQPADGYRFSIDALLLADFARPPARAAIIDLGTGCGVIPLLLARQQSDACVTGIENNPEMALLAKQNVLLNGLENRIEIISDDLLNMRSHFPVSSFDLVVSNPPYRAQGSGRISPKAGRDTARHESTATIHQFLSMAKYLVKPAGRICFVYHPSRLSELIHNAARLNLALTRLRMIHGTPEAPARIFLAEFAKASKSETAILAPLFIFDNDRAYTSEANRISGQNPVLQQP